MLLTRSIFLLPVTGLSFIGPEAGMLLELCVALSPKSGNVSHVPGAGPPQVVGPVAS